MLFCGMLAHGIINPVPIRMKPYSILVVLFLSIILVSISGCTFDSGNSPSQTQTVNTIVAGQILDETGTPVPNAEVSVGSAKTTTTLYGTFMLTNLNVPSDRVVVKAVKDGYFTAFRAEEPKSGKITQIILRMMSNAPQGYFSASSGTTLTLGNNVSVVFPANGYVTTSGTAYTGNVNYVVKHLDPESGTFYDNFSGDFQGRSLDGSISNLVSYGVLRVELTGNNGEKLNLAKGSTAKLSVPVPTSMQRDAPSTLPLWSFDETLGMWKEESVATKTGNMYTGAVSHFSDWNFDASGDRARLVIKVVCNNEIVPGVIVRVGERKVVSDEGTINIRNVPTGLEFKVKVFAEDNNGVESAEYKVGPFKKDETVTVTVSLSTCPSFVKGVLQNCQGEVCDGFVMGKYQNTSERFFGQVHKGQINLRVKENSPCSIKAYSNDGSESDFVSVSALTLNQVKNIGTIKTCNTGVTGYLDFSIDEVLKPPFPFNSVLAPNGESYIMYINNKLKIYSTTNGKLIDDITVKDPEPFKFSADNGSYPLDISNDSKIILVQTSDQHYEVYDLNTKNFLTSFIASRAFLSPDGTKISACVKDTNTNTRYIQILNAQDGSKINEIKNYKGKLFKEHFSDFLNNEEFLMSNIPQHPEPYEAFIFNVLTGTMVRRFEMLNSLGTMITFSQDGSLILGSEYYIGSFVSTVNGKEISGIKYEIGHNYSHQFYAAISPDNMTCALQIKDLDTASVYYMPPAIYKVSDGKMLRPLPIPENNPQFKNFSYSSDGKKLAALYLEKKDNVWGFKVRIWKF